MKNFAMLLVAAAAAGSCTVAPPYESQAQVARSQAKFAQLTEGKVAGAPVSCLPSYRMNDMTVIDDGTLAFGNGSSLVYINHMSGGPCTNLQGGNNTLVTKTSSSTLCRGDIAQVVDLTARIPVGSCVFGDFVPYKRVG